MAKARAGAAGRAPGGAAPAAAPEAPAKPGSKKRAAARTGKRAAGKVGARAKRRAANIDDRPIGGAAAAAPAPPTKARRSKAAARKAKRGGEGAAAPAAAACGPGGAARTKAGGAAATQAPAPPGKRNAFVPTDGPYAYEPDPDDHCETDIRAYRHLRPVLRQLEKAIYGANKGELKLWDPYYCNGSTKRHLASLGFPLCHNENEDFYAVVASKKLPPHDVIITSPPYSCDHIERCMRFCAESAKPWCVLLPNWVHKKDYYQELLRKTPGMAASPPQYLGPVGVSYNYWFPDGAEQRPAHVGDDGRTTPYATSWAIFLPSSVGGARLLKNVEPEQRRLGEWVIAKTVKGLKWCARKVEEKRRLRDGASAAASAAAAPPESSDDGAPAPATARKRRRVA